ncbi:MAG: hypothetical protein IJS65_07120 [Clostridia bacterium]|nr:hypothetical protein [Clostridia bacterium]
MGKYIPVLIALAALAALALLLTCCGEKEKSGPPDKAQDTADAGYKQITQEEAALMMQKDDGHIIIDVRRQDEFDGGHIPGAVCIPNESIGTDMPEGLPDLEQIILVYCRSGRRSREASQKLADIGYTNVYEFGGIIDWKGEVVKDDIPDLPKLSCVLVIDAGDRKIYAGFEDNPSAAAFKEKLNEGPVTVALSDYGGFEKVGELPWTLPASDGEITAEPGDIILYQGNRICFYYGENTYNFTRIAKTGGAMAESMKEVFGGENAPAQVTLYLEWGE